MDCAYHPRTVLPKIRTRIISHLVDIASNLHLMRNVHSGAAILSVLKAEGHMVPCPQEPTATFLHFMGVIVPSRRTRTALRPRW
ncbi:hypothetical protein TNCV_2358831 [Trichonephila clavipes]|nr:hypothetical protein TNCV_2358831 [Trichonephila clavipes]